jgi:hypothetical protein
MKTLSVFIILCGNEHLVSDRAVNSSLMALSSLKEIPMAIFPTDRHFFHYLFTNLFFVCNKEFHSHNFCVPISGHCHNVNVVIV